jgi:acid phosphatase class B
MTMSKDYRWVITYTEGVGWWYDDCVGLFWEGSNVFDPDKSDFLSDDELTNEIREQQAKLDKQLSQAVAQLDEL